MKIVPPEDSGLAEAAAVLRDGGIVAYPTETVYGLAVDPFNEAALARLFAAKGRTDANAVLLVIAAPAQADAVASAVDARASRYMASYWPGPLSLLLPAKPGLPAALTAGSGKVCVRCSAQVTARALAAAFGGPITSTSANRSGFAPARDVASLDVPDVAIAIDGGHLGDGATSTVFDPATGVVLREGAIPAAELLEFTRAH